MRLATDWAAYGEWMVEHFADHSGFELVQDEMRAANAPSVIAPEVREVTKFEARGERQAMRSATYNIGAGPNVCERLL